MKGIYRSLVAVVAVGVLAGCTSPSAPYLLSVTFEGNITPTEEACLVGFNITASGTSGSAANWVSAEFTVDGTVHHTFDTGNVADFFGASSIQAGATQVTERVVLPPEGRTQAEIVYTLRDSNQTMVLNIDCSVPDEEES